MIGIVRKLDSLGRVVIPKEIRKKLDIKNNDEVSISMDRDTVYIKKFKEYENKFCFMCNSQEDLVELEEKHICSKCIISATEILEKMRNNI